MLHMLREQVGTEKFWAGIREYYRRFRDSNASTADFEKVMEESSGADLGWFFQQWLYRAGSPEVEGAWRYNPQTGKLELNVIQRQPGAVYRLPMEVAVDSAIARIEMTAKQQRFELDAPKAPAAVVLDPGTRVLMDARVTKK